MLFADGFPTESLPMCPSCRVHMQDFELLRFRPEFRIPFRRFNDDLFFQKDKYFFRPKIENIEKIDPTEGICQSRHRISRRVEDFFQSPPPSDDEGMGARLHGICMVLDSNKYFRLIFF